MDALERNKTVEENLRLVTSRVVKLNHGVYNDDLFQAGALALCLAVERFDPDRGCTFATYAIPYIDGYILQYKNHDSAVKPWRRYGKFIRPTVISMETSVSQEDPELTLGSILPADVGPEHDTIDDVFIAEFINRLPDIERIIFSLRMSYKTQKEIAVIVGKSQTHVSRKLKVIRNKYLIFKSE